MTLCGKETWLSNGLRGPSWRCLGLNYLAVLHPRELPIQGAATVKWRTPAVQWWELQCRVEEAESELHNPPGGTATERKASRRTQNRDACQQITSTICPNEPEKQRGPKKEMFPLKMFGFPVISVPLQFLSLKEPFQVSPGKGKALNQLWRFFLNGLASYGMCSRYA